ncbi:MAG: hypothetical protein ACU843_01105 [Gammaproteobacteria bacterium]
MNKFIPAFSVGGNGQWDLQLPHKIKRFPHLILAVYPRTGGISGYINGLLRRPRVNRIEDFGVSQIKENYRYRVFGMTMTFATLLLCSAYLLVSNVW